jgi:formylglycine-generating enzyme required for sulfatase activity
MRNSYSLNISKIINFFRHTEGSGLILCVCGNSDFVGLINRKVVDKASYAELEIVEVYLTTENLVDFVQRIRMVAGKRPDGIIINNLDTLISESDGVVLTDINLAREILIDLDVPLLIWLSEENISLFANKAPDLFLRKDRGIVQFSGTFLEEELEETRNAIAELEKMRGKMPQVLLGTTLAALIEQRDELKNSVASLDRSGAAARVERARPAAPRSVMSDVSDSAILIRGDNEVQIAVHKEPSIHDPAEALNIYCEILFKMDRYLPMRGIDLEAGDPGSRQRRMDLANVYIDLNTRTHVPISPTGKETDRHDREFLSEKGETRPLRAIEATAGNRSVVLLGDPGSGKTTFLNHLTFCLAAHRLKPYSGWIERLSGWPEGEADAIPVPVVLRDFAGWMADDAEKVGPQALLSFISDRLEALKPDFLVPLLEEALEEGRAVFLLDGLDEIPSGDRPALVHDAIISFAERYDKSRFVVTCRVLSYRDAALQLEGFAHFELAQFDDEMIMRFINAWHKELARLGTVKTEEEAERMASRLQQAVRRADLWRLAPNPLLLTVMALVNTHKGRLPEARAMLYEEVTDILLWRWDQLKATGEKTLPRLRELLMDADRSDMDLKRVLWRLAFDAQQKGGDGEALADIEEWQLQDALVGLHPKRSLDWAHQVINTIKLRVGLLLEREPGIYTFPHRTFQEYLAGAHLSTQPDFARQAAGLAGEGPFWREVILLAVGRLVYVSGELDKATVLVQELCPAKPEDTDTAWRKTWLAGEVLVEIGLNRVKETSLGKELAERVPLRLVEVLRQSGLSPVARAAAGRVLAKLGDPRVEVLVPERMEFCDIPAGPFTMGSGKDDSGAAEDEQRQHSFDIPYDYKISRYPVTNVQFRVFIDAGGYSNWSYWKEAEKAGIWKDGMVECYLDESPREVPCDFSEPFKLANHPVVAVAWYEALAFTRWLTERQRQNGDLPDGWHVCLPSEPEWEKAARGETRSIYPWGDEPDSNLANYADTGIGSTSAVGCFPGGGSPYGVEELSGNVLEWTRSLWGGYPYPKGEEAQRRRESLGATREEPRVLRGGAFLNSGWFVRCAFRHRHDPDHRHDLIGFRVVLSPFFSGL